MTTQKHKIFFSIILGFILFSGIKVQCQEEAVLNEEYEEVYVDPYFQEDYKIEEFSSKQIEAARKGIDFSKDYITKKEKEAPVTPNIDSDGLGDFASGVFKALFIIALIAVIIAVLFHMIGDAKLFKPKSKKIIGAVTAMDLEKIEDNLEESDIEPFLKKAIEDNDYKVAIRLYFLIAIRDLSKNKFIKWKKDKTNRDYIRETRSLPIGKHFKETAHIYEKAWYGDFEVKYSDFQILEKKFNDLISQIKIKGA